MAPRVHSSTVRHSQEAEAPQGPVHDWMDKGRVGEAEGGHIVQPAGGGKLPSAAPGNLEDGIQSEVSQLQKDKLWFSARK